MSRLDGAIRSIRKAIWIAADIHLEAIGPDDDLIEDLGLKPLELLSLALIVEEVFAIAVPDDHFEHPRHRTAASLAEWAIGQSDHHAWLEAQAGRRRA